MCAGHWGKGTVPILIAYLLQFLLPTTVFLSYQPFLTLKYSFQSSNRERMEERKEVRRQGEREGRDCWSGRTGAFGVKTGL